MAKAAAALLLVSVVVLLLQVGARPVVSSGVSATRTPYIVQVRREQATIAWKTDVSATSEVHYGTTPELGLTATGPSGRFHAVRLTSLQRGTTYYYRARSNGTYVNAVQSLRTLVGPGSPSLRFAVVGDFGNGSAAEVAVENQVVARSPKLVMTTGDNVYPSGSEANLDTNVFPQYADLLDNVGMNAALGNHDVVADGGWSVKRSLRIPSRGYYSFDASSGHFVVLDSNNRCLASSCPQMQWLRADLAATNQPMVFVFFHHSISSCGDHATDEQLRAAWHPIFSTEGVDVVFMGHDHGYQRSKPVGGVTYVTTGGGGAGLYTWTRPCTQAAFIADATTSPDAHHLVLVDLAAGQATIRAINRDGVTLDRAVIAP